MKVTYLPYLLLVTLIAVRSIGALTLPIYDDAFITFRYAENLVNHGAFVYNVGEWVQAVTAPMFGLIVAGICSIGLPITSSVIILNIVVDGLILFTSYKLLTSYVDERSAILFSIFYIISPTITRITIGGMEANLFLLGSIGSIILHHKGKILESALLSSLLCFIRPEGVILFGLLLLKLIKTKQIKKSLLSAMIGASVILPALLYLQSVYGTFIPHSVVAKSQDTHQSILYIFQRMAVPELFAIIMFCCSLLGLVSIHRQDSRVKSIIVWVGFYLAAYLVMRPWIWTWYSLPVQYGIMLLSAMGGSFLISKLTVFRNLLSNHNIAVAGSVIVLLIWSAVLVKEGRSGVTENIYEPLARWGVSEDLSNKKIFATDIGVVGYYSKAYIYDGIGLITPDALDKLPIKQRVKEKQFDYLFLNYSKETAEIMSDSNVHRMYTPIKRFSKIGSKETTLLPESSPTEWVQDYILYKRVK
jgi:arabinofuranosyltransferase